MKNLPVNSKNQIEWNNSSRKAFTLIELLVVIAIIGILAAVVIASLNSTRAKARNARRDSDMHQIYTALVMYHSEYGCLPITTGSTCGPAQGTYSEYDTGGFDMSNIGGFMTFLETAGFISKVPVDPINDIAGGGSSGYGYMYYCYPVGVPSVPNGGLRLRYHKENPRTVLYKGAQGGVVTPDSTFNCR